jgi:hypothetical protein
MSWKQVLVWLTITSLAATAVLAIGVLLLGDFGEGEGRVLLTTVAIAVCGLLALPAAVLREQNRAPVLATATIALTATLFVVFELTLWSAENSEYGWKLVGTLAAATGTATQISALTSRLRSGDRQSIRIVYVAACGLIVLIALLTMNAIWAEVDDGAYYRVLAALAVLNVFVLVLQPLMRRLGPKAEEAFRVRLSVEPGGTDELELGGRDFADAVATAIRKAERRGRHVTRVERL